MPENKQRVVGVVPARLGSTRLPEKMMADIHGRPLIVWTAEAAVRSGAFDRVIVATDHQRIFHAVEDAGFEVMMTDAALPSGSARVAEVAERIKADVLINIQGDEPLVDAVALKRLVMAFQDQAVQMATLSFPLSAEDEQNPNAVKVVCDAARDALYFSRSLIPFPRNREQFAPLKHIGVYGYRRETLLHLMKCPPCALEQVESLEQLRALCYGIKIRLVQAHTSTLGVDTPEDLERVRAALKKE